MKKTLVVVIASALTTQFAFANALTDVSGSVATSAKNSSEIIAGVVTKTSGHIMMLSEKSSAAGLNLSQSAFNSAKGISLKGLAVSETSVTMVLDFSGKAANLTSNTAKSVVTASGQLIPAVLSKTGNAILVSVKKGSNASATVLDATSKVVIGSVKWSANAASAVGNFALDASGQLLDASGAVVGWVVDSSGRVIKLAISASGKIATVLGNGSEVVMTGSSQALKSTANAVASAARGSVNAISDLFEAAMKVSKLGSLVVVTISEKATGSVVGSIRFSSQTITNLFDSIVSKQSDN